MSSAIYVRVSIDRHCNSTNSLLYRWTQMIPNTLIMVSHSGRMGNRSHLK